MGDKRKGRLKIEDEERKSKGEENGSEEEIWTCKGRTILGRNERKGENV